VVGNAVLERITGVPPLRPRTRAGMSFIACAGRLSVSLVCDPHYFTAHDVRELLDRFISRLAAAPDR
jgi:hypothetical protein